MSKAFTFNKADLIHTLKVFGWSVLATAISTLIVIVGKIQVDPAYLFLVPVVNTVLIGLQRWAQDHSTGA